MNAGATAGRGAGAVVWAGGGGVQPGAVAVGGVQVGVVGVHLPHARPAQRQTLAGFQLQPLQPRAVDVVELVLAAAGHGAGEARHDQVAHLVVEQHGLETGLAPLPADAQLLRRVALGLERRIAEVGVRALVLAVVG